MTTTDKTLKVLIVDDNRDGADALGLLVEALGHQVHVTYGGATATICKHIPILCDTEYFH